MSCLNQCGKYLISKSLDLVECLGPGDILMLTIIVGALDLYKLEHAFINQAAKVEEGTNCISD